MYTTSKTPDLTKEYSPSQNTKRFQSETQPHKKVLEHFVEVITTQTIAMRQTSKIRENVYYGLGEQTLDDRQLLDIYYKDDVYDTPIFVYIHGGFWQALDKSSSGSFVVPLIEMGFRVLVVDYNLCPSVSLEQLTHQLKNFFVWLSNYAKKTRASSISICGHSAGAHLATLLLEPAFNTIMDLKVNKFFLISGIYDLRELWRLPCVNPNDILALDARKSEALSPLLWNFDNAVVEYCREKGVAFHVLVAENDSETFIQQTRAFAEKLQDADLKVKSKVFPNYDHFDIIEELANEGSDINAYLQENVK